MWLVHTPWSSLDGMYRQSHTVPTTNYVPVVPIRRKRVKSLSCPDYFLNEPSRHRQQSLPHVPRADSTLPSSPRSTTRPSSGGRPTARKACRPKTSISPPCATRWPKTSAKSHRALRRLLRQVCKASQTIQWLLWVEIAVRLRREPKTAAYVASDTGAVWRRCHGESKKICQESRVCII